MKVFHLFKKQIEVLLVCNNKNIVTIFKKVRSNIGDHTYIVTITQYLKKLGLVTKTPQGREVIVKYTKKGEKLAQLYNQINELMK